MMCLSGDQLQHLDLANMCLSRVTLQLLLRVPARRRLVPIWRPFYCLFSMERLHRDVLCRVIQSQKEGYYGRGINGKHSFRYDLQGVKPLATRHERT
jgi:hypothetical protein